MSIEHYTYELRKSRLGAAFGDKVAIREDWIKRTRRYVVSQGLDLNKLALFVKRNLYDRRVEGFNQQALEEPLSRAQQWTLMFIILSDFGVPEWLRDPTKDELTPDMVVAEPEEEEESVASAILSTPAGILGLSATVASATIDTTKKVGDAALGVAATPVKSLSGLVASTASVAEGAIQEVDAAIAEAVSTETPVEEAPVEEAPAESETTEEPPATEEETGEDQGE